MAKKILLVEDDSKTSHAISKIVINCGYELSKAVNGNDAIKQFQKINPDLVLMDISMPERDGDDAAIKIKKEFPNAKIILMTAFGRDWVKNGVNLEGILGILHKPFKTESLKKLLEKFV